MAEIATCPQCAAQLGLPDSFGPLDFAVCPECQAKFSLGEVERVSLPVAKLVSAPQTEPIPPNEIPGTQLASAEGSDLENDVDAGYEHTELKSQQNWEERLKRALALDCETETEKAVPTTNQSSPSEPAKIESPSFEFQLDPPPAEAAEPLSPDARTMPNLKTLAEFAAEAVDTAEEATAAVVEQTTRELPEIDLAKPMAGSFSTPTMEPPPSPSPPVNKRIDTPTAQESSVGDALVEVTTSSIQGRRTRGRGFPKVAAFAVGPVVGSLLGLYGLLWLQGSNADYVGLRHVLPSSVLPPSVRTTALATADEMEPTSEEMPIEKRLDEQQAPAAVMQDDAVSLASATQPLARPLISADEFTERVDLAAGAASEFVTSTLSTPESTKRKGQAYMKLCKLAEHFDFAKQLGLAPTVEAKSVYAQQLLANTIGNRPNRPNLDHIAGRWWEYAERPNAGILFGGKVVAADPADAGTICWVQLENASSKLAIPVWVSDANDFKVGDSLGVVGRIVSAADNLPADFEGNQIVRLLHSFAL
ncbi:MAG: hypothetical protein AAGD11_10740 [Planctomycetota bacterium]